MRLSIKRMIHEMLKQPGTFGHIFGASSSTESENRRRQEKYKYYRRESEKNAWKDFNRKLYLDMRVFKDSA